MKRGTSHQGWLDFTLSQDPNFQSAACRLSSQALRDQAREVGAITQNTYYGDQRDGREHPASHPSGTRSLDV